MRLGRKVREVALLALGGSAVLAAIVLFAPESPKYVSRVEREPVSGERDPIESAKAPEALLAAYRAERARYRDIDYRALEKELAIGKEGDRELGFDPEQALFYDRIASELALDPGEMALYRTNGLVSVDHVQRYSMGSAYYAIYARDLPVFVTSDSVLHALHRSYDDLLKRLESKLFLPALSEALALTHAELERLAPELGSGLLASARDVDVYLSVARSLVEGRGLPAPSPDSKPLLDRLAELGRPGPGSLSRLDQGDEVEALLSRIAAGSPGDPEAPIELYGGRRSVDFTQFRPRGHYTESDELGRYFRAMMWLGRSDTGFVLAAPDARSGLHVNADRELTSASLLALAVNGSGARTRLAAIARTIDFLIGRSDSLTLEAVVGALDRAGIRSAAGLESTSVPARLRRELGGSGEQAIRSQILVSPGSGGPSVLPPELFQLMGQRFAIDSFVLSEVVFDSIEYKGRNPGRVRPSGLDVMAALGNDEAVKLLKPELDKHDYSSNLLALRRTIDARAPEAWQRDVYGLWLDALRSLDDVPEGAFPSVARREPWRRKQLQTQLGSWSELRHDTILYAKQSYTAWPSCSYPAGFVEPYPEFFAKLERLAETAATELASVGAELSSPELTQAAKVERERAVAYFESFGRIMTTLRRLAEKELRKEPFTPEEERFFTETIARERGSGPPRYDGWYSRLFYDQEGVEIDRWKPAVSDVHTNPRDRETLQEGVGDVNFLVVAIDNGDDRVAYVGPVYSYYEFWSPIEARLTDKAWQARIESGELPPRPEFTRAFAGAARPRELGPRRDPHDPSDARTKLTELYAQYRSAAPAERERLYREIKAVQAEPLRR